MGIAGMDRKAMEEERLARLAKKRAASSDVETNIFGATIPVTKIKAASISPPPLAKRPRLNPLPSTIPIANETQQDPSTNPSTLVQYPEGAIKKTWCLNHPRTDSDDITFAEVLQPFTLTTAMLSSWQLDMEYLTSNLSLSRTKLIIVMQSKDEAEKKLWREETAQWSKTLRLCFPPLAKGIYGTMHSKLMLLFHPTHLRIVVPTANLVPRDWGETGVMENSVFLIDLPRLPKASEFHGSKETRSAPPTLLPFAKDLIYFLDAQGVDDCMPDPSAKSITSSLLNFDFSNTKHLAFIHTIAGAHYGADAALSTGWPQLSRCVRQLGLASGVEEELEIDYAASSIGALTEEKVDAFVGALRGAVVDLPTPASISSATARGPPTTSLKGKGKGQQGLSFKPVGASTSTPPHPPPTPSQPSNPQRLRKAKQQIRIQFPTLSTILTSAAHGAGPTAAGTIFLPRTTFSKPTFPRHLLHDLISTRGLGVLSHNKLIYCRTSAKPASPMTTQANNNSKTKPKPNAKAYVYIGSANFSPAAWGCMPLEYVKSRKEVCLRASNWECGILMRVLPTGDGIAGENGDIVGASSESGSGQENGHGELPMASAKARRDSDATESTLSEDEDERKDDDETKAASKIAHHDPAQSQRTTHSPSQKDTVPPSTPSLSPFTEKNIPIPFICPGTPYVRLGRRREGADDDDKEECDEPWMQQV